MKEPALKMRPVDLLGLALSAFRQQKGRTALTVLGVAIGTFALFVSLAIGLGVDRAILRLFRGTTALRQVNLHLQYEAAKEDMPDSETVVEGPMSAAKRERLRYAQIRSWNQRHVSRPKYKLDRSSLNRLAQLPHVERVVPVVSQRGTMTLEGVGEPQEAGFASADSDGQYGDLLIAGRELARDDAREAVVHEFFLYKLGLVTDGDVQKALGRTIRFEFRTPRGGELSFARLLSFGTKPFTPAQSEHLIRLLGRFSRWMRLLPIPAQEREAFQKLMALTPVQSDEMEEDSFAETFTVVGVIREALEEDEKARRMPGMGRDWAVDLILPPQTAAEFYLKAPAFAREGLYQTVLIVDDDTNVKDVSKAVETLGLMPWSAMQFIETIRMNVLLVSVATAFIAVVALTVAAIGITNTMLMSVLERTHEIGIMKALGARTGQVRLLFLVEGASVGFLGGSLGLLLGWIASVPGDSIARSIMQAQAPRPIEGSLFAFPVWLVLGTQLLATLVTMLAALYPAHRAARLDPIVSLRHE